MSNTKKAAAAGIIGEAVYFLSMTLFLASQAEWALTLWEIMSVAGAVLILVVLAVVTENMKSLCRTLMLIAASGTIFITAIAHITSIGAVRRLAAQGEPIPDYFKIGKFPSIEMSLDYTAWGLFMGLAFLCLFLGTKTKRLKVLSMICTLLCFSGFVGSFFSENLWYPAPMGYGFGFLVMCIFWLKGDTV